jgi:predicted RNase H-related nuclease YkuK (DUF458 family)
VTGYGYESACKPNAFAASKVSDRKC